MQLFLNTLPSKLVLLCITTLLFYASSFAQQNDTAVKVCQPSIVLRTFYGTASFYSNKFSGRKTAFGEIFKQNKLTCACNFLPLGTWIRVTNMVNGRTVIVKTNDRLHPKMKRIIDLAKTAAVQLNYVSAGLTRVKVEVLDKNPANSE